MTADLTLRIEHASGETSTLVVPTPVAIDEDDVTLASIRIDRALDRVARCEARVFRPDWLDVLDKVDRRNDEAFVDTDDGETIFGGRLDGWQFESVTVSVFIDSFEVDALGAEPPTSFSRTDEPDDAIATDAIGLVPSWSPVTVGTVEQTTDSIDADETHAAPGEILRRLARDTGAEVGYRADGTADYLDERGETHSEVISPSAGVVVEDPRIRETLREEITNVRAVSQSDSDIFEEAEAIATDSDDREKWSIDRIDSTSNSRLQSRATRLANEYADAPEYLEIETTLDPLALDGDVTVGDRYPVELPAYGINEELRIVEAVRRIDEAGEQVEVVLANRTETVSGRDGPLAV